MNRPTIAALSLTSLALLAAGTDVASAAVEKAMKPIAGQYIAVLRPGVTRAADAGPADGPALPEVAAELTFRHGGALRRMYSAALEGFVGSSRVDLQACKLEYSIVSPK